MIADEVGFVERRKTDERSIPAYGAPAPQFEEYSGDEDLPF